MAQVGFFPHSHRVCDSNPLQAVSCPLLQLNIQSHLLTTTKHPITPTYYNLTSNHTTVPHHHVSKHTYLLQLNIQSRHSIHHHVSKHRINWQQKKTLLQWPNFLINKYSHIVINNHKHSFRTALTTPPDSLTTPPDSTLPEMIVFNQTDDCLQTPQQHHTICT